MKVKMDINDILNMIFNSNIIKQLNAKCRLNVKRHMRITINVNVCATADV